MNRGTRKSPGTVLGKKDGTRNALRQSIFKAVCQIEQNLDDPPAANQLARTAGVSISHFHGAFRAVVGESVTQHVLRLRVERAASLLAFSNWQAGDIGLACGFRTQASFSRGFKRFYGMTPRQFREVKSAVPFLRGRLRTRPRELLETPHVPLPTVRMETWPELQGIGLRFYGRVKEVYKPWSELLTWAKGSIPDLERARFLGLWFDEWCSKDEDHYRYECIIIPASPVEEPPAPFFSRRLTAGEVAVSHAAGSLSALDRAWRAFGTGWLPFSGFQPRGEFSWDEYPADLVLSSPLRPLLQGKLGLISMEMCIPVQTAPVTY